ncbi:permease-like cell division protein FtsX [Clostridium cochlearium]|uniref:permease-like cell division protein FtsX n=1 Tax=Clostridium cochlearium TaxID=1494 RepID=UPI0015707FF0|nr:permease-like cell division protein FtsX [Clostridium cochlearium]MBV1818351.1 permease-like cell division protein FtsX [Bacteroidales bacterium MSK.15.36]NSJ91347.1 ABC transporter permease [Coprococcus sp. MSK.21.13]MCG4570951.1 permease-like cell division protein FtsX [Clostridium cochlearium]MCG4579651.1 permease-like cell division protein FtsX [Clostridium cochlearium]MCR1971075.1 permease-like cell division protein FtsX [Clostridium cochlearium]
MKISSIKYFISDSLKSIRRNKTISLASAATVAATLFILGVFMLSALNVKQVIKNVESKVEITVFLRDDITIGQQKELETKINAIDKIVDVRYESKEEAVKKFEEQLGEENKDLVKGLEKENPLPSSFILKVKDPEMVTDVVDEIKDLKGIEKIREGKKTVEKIVSVTKTIKWVGMILFIILIGVSLFLIGNTIKITVYSRRREIGIMKYIGATDWFIRWPFVIEGGLIGITGAIIGFLVLYYLYNAIYPKMAKALYLVDFINPSYILTSISWQFILAGILIGTVGSILSIRKFLAV